MRMRAACLVLTSGVLLLLPACGRRRSVPALEPAAEPALARPTAPAIQTVTQERQSFYPFPMDAGGRLLQKQLTPDAPPEEKTTSPRARKAPATIDNPSLPLPRVAALPRLNPELGRKSVYPQLLTPEPLPPETTDEIALPEFISLPVYERANVPSPDLNRPVPLPALSQPLPDKPPLGDPTRPVSQSAVLSGPMPARTAPAAFLRLFLPDPDENRGVIRFPALDQKETLPD